MEKIQTRRAPLSRDRILAAALELVDAEGLDALTIRRLAKELGVEGASLYKHIPSKSALLFGLTQLLFTEMDPDYPEDPLDWKGRLLAGMRAFRELGLKHPRVFVLLNRPWQASPTRVESELTSMIGSGMTKEQAAYAFRLLSSFVVGFVSWETSALVRDPEELRDMEAVAPVVRSPELYPNTIATQPYLEGSNTSKAFEFGLAAALQGISAMVFNEAPASEPRSS